MKEVPTKQEIREYLKSEVFPSSWKYMSDTEKRDAIQMFFLGYHKAINDNK